MQRAAGWAAEPSIHQILALAHLLEEQPQAFSLDPSTGLMRHSQACGALWSALRKEAEAALSEIDDSQHLLDFAYHLVQRLDSCVCPKRTNDQAHVPCCGARSGAAEIPETYLRSLLSTFDPCPLVGDSVLSADWSELRWGTVKWAVQRAALRIIGQPTYYADIADFVRKNNERWHDIDDGNVLAALIDNDRFVITGARGIYGLREWNVSTYETVADRVEAYLQDRGRAAPVWKIIDVLVERDVPETNIRACLTQARFILRTDGTVGLAEWAQKPRDEALPVRTDTIFRDPMDDGFIIG